MHTNQEIKLPIYAATQIRFDLVCVIRAYTHFIWAHDHCDNIIDVDVNATIIY